MDFLRAVNVLYKRKWLILLSAVLAVSLTYGATRLIGARWSGTVRIRMPAAEFRAIAVASGAKYQAPKFDLKRESRKWLVMATTPSVVQPALQEVGQRRGTADIAKQISVAALEAGYIDLKIQGPSPVYISRFGNALAQSLSTAYETQASQESTLLVTALEERLKAAEKDVAKSRTELGSFRRSRGVILGVSDTLSPVLNRLYSAMSQRDELEARLAETDARLEMERELLATLPERVPVETQPADAPLVLRLRQQLAEVESQLVTLKTLYTDEHIEIKRLMAQRDAQEQRMEIELAKSPAVIAEAKNPRYEAALIGIASLEQDRKSVTALLRSAKRQTSQQQSKLGSYRGLDMELAPLMHAVTSDEARVSGIEQRLKEAHLAEVQAATASKLVIEAPIGRDNPPINETEGRTKKLLLLALLASVMGSAALVIGLDSVDRRVKTVVEAEEALALPVRAAIPRPLTPTASRELARTTELEPLSLQSEAYRFLGLHLLLPGQRPVQSIMVMSAKANQGTTSTACNLAITLAQAGRRVILVDANLRSPSLHEIFELDGATGLTTLLSAEGMNVREVLQDTRIENLTVLPAGPPADNPWQLMRSRSMEHLATQLRSKADFVLYDTPSALAFTDAFNLAPIVDAAFVVLRALEAPTGSERRLLELLKMAHVEVLGSVLHGVPASLLDSHTNYQHYYPEEDRRVPALVASRSATGMAERPDPLGAGGSSNGRNRAGDGHGSSTPDSHVHDVDPEGQDQADGGGMSQGDRP